MYTLEHGNRVRNETRHFSKVIRYSVICWRTNVQPRVVDVIETKKKKKKRKKR